MQELRPMTFGEVLDASLTIYRRHFGLFLRLAVAIVAVPLGIYLYLFTRAQAEFMTDPLGAASGVLLGILLQGLASLVLTAATIRVISDSYLGREPAFREAAALALAKLWRLVVVWVSKNVLAGVIMAAVGIVIALLVFALRSAPLVLAPLLIVVGGAGIWLLGFVLCGYGVTTPVVVLEELASSFDAFARSWDLTRGFKLRVLGFWFVATVLFAAIPAAILQAIGGAIFTGPTSEIATVVAGAAGQIILAPVISCVITLMYYDLRVRREAFDLHVLGQQLGIV